MAGFKNPDLRERQEAAAKAKKAALQKFLAKAADPALAERLTARTAGAAERKAVRTVRETEKAETKARDAERAVKAEREAALQAERDKTERAQRESTLQAEQKAARDARYAARKSKSKRK
jgi:predicted kinase